MRIASFVFACALAFGIGACGRRSRTLSLDLKSSLLRAADNPMAIEGKYRNKRLVFDGKAVALGYMTRDEIAVTSVSQGLVLNAYGVATTESTQRTNEYRFGYVALGTDQSTDGVLVCLFDEHDDVQAAHISRGESVRLSGFVKKVVQVRGDEQKNDGIAAIMLNRCRVERTTSEKT